MLAEGNPGTAAQEYVSVPALLEVDFDASNTNVLTPVWKVLVAPGTAPGPLTVMVIGLVPPPPPPPPGSAVSVKVPVPAGENRTAVPATSSATLIIFGGVSDVKPKENTAGTAV